MYLLVRRKQSLWPVVEVLFQYQCRLHLVMMVVTILLTPDHLLPFDQRTIHLAEGSFEIDLMLSYEIVLCYLHLAKFEIQISHG